MGIVDDRLPDWLHGISLDPSGEDIAGHRRVVDSIAKVTTTDNVLLLVGYAHQLCGAATNAAFANIQQAAVAADESWNTGVDSLLSRRLASAALAQLLSGDSRASVAGALATSAATFIAAEPGIAELPGLAEASLIRLADLVRSSGLPGMPTARQRADAQIKSQLPQQTPDGEPAVAASTNQLRGHVTELRGAVRIVADETDASIRKLMQHSKRLAEEVDLLWWALEPQSELIPGLWKNSGLSGVVATAVELAQRLSLDPPARGTRGIAWRALLAAQLDPRTAHRMSEIIDAGPPAAVGDLHADDETFVWSRPALFALRERGHDQTGSQSWYAAFAAKSGIQGDTTASNIDWVLRLVRDLSLERVIGK